MALPTSTDERTGRPALVVAALVGITLFLLPLVGPAYFQTVMTKVLIFAIFALSLDILWGYTGLFSLGHATFLGVGGYTAAKLMVGYGIDSVWVAVLAGLTLSAVAGAVIGVIALRVAGAHFLLVTLAIGQLMVATATKWGYLSPGLGNEGIFGLTNPDLGIGDDFRWTNATFYYLALAVFALCFLMIRHFTRTPVGVALQGVRENEDRMLALGFNTWAYRYFAFVTGSAFAGVAGVLLAYSQGFMIPETLGIGMSTVALLMVLIGGPGTLYGPILGAGLITLLEFFVSSYLPERWPLILGSVYVASVMLLRGGIVNGVRSLMTSHRRVRSNTTGADSRENSGSGT